MFLILVSKRLPPLLALNTRRGCPPHTPDTPDSPQVLGWGGGRAGGIDLVGGVLEGVEVAAEQGQQGPDLGERKRKRALGASREVHPRRLVHGGGGVEGEKLLRRPTLHLPQNKMRPEEVWCPETAGGKCGPQNTFWLWQLPRRNASNRRNFV